MVVHNELLDEAERAKWRKLAAVPWARLVGRYGPDDLYLLSGDTAGPSVEKVFSWDYARDKEAVQFEARATGPGAARRWIDVEMNGQRVGQLELDGGWTRVMLPLDGPRHRSAAERGLDRPPLSG